MSDWKVIKPEAATNLVPNPSFEESITVGVTIYANGTADGNRQRLTAVQKYGAYALYLEKDTGADADRYGIYETLTATSTSAQDYIASCWVWLSSGTMTIELLKVVGVGVQQSVTVSTSTLGEWVQLTTAALTANATGDTLRLYVYITGAPTKIAYADALVAYADDHIGTYVDGDQEGCEWIGAPHNSSSRRSAVSRSGGRIYDLQDDYSLNLSTLSGSGMVSISQIMDEFALAPGGEVQGFKEHARMFVLGGLLETTSTANLHAQRQALISLLAPHSVPSNQPLTIRYTGSAVNKEIRAYYDGGLELTWDAAWCSLERVALRFLAADPFWYEVGNSAAALDKLDSPTLRYVAARLKDTGQWDDLGLTANPTAD